MHLRALLSAAHRRDAAQSHELSRSDRFSIAEALAWGMLHLCDSPWLDDSISDDAVSVVLESDHGSKNIRIVDHPFLTNTLPPPSRIRPESGSPTATDHGKPKSHQFASSQIENMAVYTLAIRLIELGIGKSFQELQQDFEDSMALPPSTSPMREFEVALHHIETLNHEVGINYSNAVKSCLKFKFFESPKKSFENRAFRRAFFHDVVAPIQALLDATLDL
ncbi:hypothetical protein EKO04_007777 [Ascochyta lentis]|uniref:DUF7580 domain-containing protein n=1 Tax=Ascochyta lentis TaxID=205686 RepID=A0A8H7MGN2_9PLEO|nr:hypothetical protein EKO04_007777 [Ascochyta lentis]